MTFKFWNDLKFSRLSEVATEFLILEELTNVSVSLLC